MILEYDYWTGDIHQIKETLIRSVAQYIAVHKKVKVGITNNPQARASKHRSGTVVWDKMIIKYHTTSANYINQLEKIIIEHHWEDLENERAGGGGPTVEGNQYLYVLLKD